MISRGRRDRLLVAGGGVLLALSALSALPAAVVINEIHYHPRAERSEEEFVELHNTADAGVDLGGWRFTDGVEFTFPPGARIEAGGFLVVARDAERLRARADVEDGLVAGQYAGALSNGGERLRLEDAEGRRVDEVHYLDEHPWPSAADGEGPSLERIDPTRDGRTPRNWLPSVRDPEWIHVSVEGKATSDVLYLYLEGAGECLIDDLRIVALGSEENVFPEGDFETDDPEWSMAGSHAGSFVTSEDSYSGTRSLRLVASGPGGSASTSVTRVIGALEPGSEYVLSFEARAIEGSTSLIHRVSGGGLLGRVDLRRLDGTPGRENAARSEELPPFVSMPWVEPELVRPGEVATLLAIVEDEDLEEVLGLYDDGGGLRAVRLRDDGASGDGVAGDGVFGGALPGAGSGAIVECSVEVTDRAGHRVETPRWRYAVDSYDVESELPVYHLFIRDVDLSRLEANIWTDEYFPAVLVHDGRSYGDVGLRFRGGRPRLFRKKSLKVRLSDRNRFAGHSSGPRRRLNLNAAAMDDDYITEPLAYWLYARAGVPASETRMVRVQLNGEFHGIFVDVEQVDEPYLAKRGLDPEGALYKSVGIVGSLRKLDGMRYNGNTYTYETQYEKKTREDEPYDDLVAFIHGLYDTPAAGWEAYLDAHLDVEGFVDYLAASCVMCIWDNIQHNFYFFRDTRGDGRWRILPWDNDHAWGEWEWRYYHGDTYPLLMGTESSPFAGVWYTWNRLWTVLLSVPRYRAMYYDRVRELLNSHFAEGPVFREVDTLVEAARPTVLLDEARWPDASEPLHAGPRRTMDQELPLLRANVSSRRAYLADQLGVELIDVPADPAFRRGDVDGDGRVGLADAIALLRSLFRGEGAVPCADAADGDDSGALEITDAVYLLVHLYRGGAPPPPPYPACGHDPTADGLRCHESPSCAR